MLNEYLWKEKRESGLKPKRHLRWAVNLNYDSRCFSSPDTFGLNQTSTFPKEEHVLGAEGSGITTPRLVPSWFFCCPCGWMDARTDGRTHTRTLLRGTSLTLVLFFNTSKGMALFFQWSLVFSKGQVPTPRKRLYTPSLPSATIFALPRGGSPWIRRNRGTRLSGLRTEMILKRKEQFEGDNVGS